MIYFNSKDRDRDGRISFDEFCDRETVAERAFRAMDVNGDGYISRAEMLQASSRGARRQVNEVRQADMLYLLNLYTVGRPLSRDVLVSFLSEVQVTNCYLSPTAGVICQKTLQNITTEWTPHSVILLLGGQCTTR